MNFLGHMFGLFGLFGLSGLFGLFGLVCLPGEVHPVK